MGSPPDCCGCVGGLRGELSLAEDCSFFGGGGLLWPGGAPEGHGVFSDHPGALTLSHSLLLPLFPFGQGLPPGKPDLPHFPSSPSVPPQVNFFFLFFGLWNTELCVSCQSPKTRGCHAFVPDAQALLVWLSEVKQTHYYGMEPSSVSGSLGTEQGGEARMGWS